VRTARARLPRLARLDAVVALALGLVLLAGIYVLTQTREEPAKPPSGPKVVARLKPGGALAQVVTGFRSAWVLDTTGDRLLRMNPATRHVTATIPLRASIAADVGSDAIWVSEGLNDVARIDPQTNRVVARVPLLRGTSSEGEPVAIGNAVWIVGTTRAVRIDARTNRVTKAVTVAHRGYEIRAAAKLGGDLWVLVRDGRIVRLDGQTGARKATFQAPFVGAFGAFGDALYLADDNQAVKLDPATGRVVWSVPADQVGAAAASRGVIWVDTAGNDGDQVIALNPRNGRILNSVHVGEFSVLTMASVGDELWLGTAGGQLVILRL
jgi:outer membrane protein assembly factor BamB